MEPYQAELAVQLAKQVGDFTFEYVSTKLKIAKEAKNIETARNTYEEVINSLLQKNNDITRIAQEYKNLYERVSISDQDIEYLQSTIKSVLELFSQYKPQNTSQDSIDVVLKLVSKETLKTMQLLGFNYKEAIGEPLTDACSNFLRNKFEVKKQIQNNHNKNK